MVISALYRSEKVCDNLGLELIHRIHMQKKYHKSDAAYS